MLSKNIINDESLLIDVNFAFRRRLTGFSNQSINIRTRALVNIKKQILILLLILLFINL